MYTMNFEKAIGIIKDALNDGITLDAALNRLQDTYFIFDDEIEELYSYFTKNNVIPMNSVELKQYLVNMYNEAMKSNSIAFANVLPVYHMAIIDCIMSQYMTVSDYYENDAIKTYSHFLKTGNLVLEVK